MTSTILQFYNMRLLLTTILSFCASFLMAQEGNKPFHCYLANDEYSVYLRINFYDQDIEIPGQELYGPLPGYLGKKNNSFCWVITSCEIVNGKEARLELINDFGSEDLQATLTQENDSVYTLRQQSGSTIKVPNHGKWQRLPKKLVFIRHKK